MTLERLADADHSPARPPVPERLQANEAAARASFARVLPIFSIVFAVVYFLCVGANVGPIAYYPLIGEIHITPQPKSAGPPMMWYGWMINAALAGAIVSAAALLGPRRWLDALVGRAAWLVPGVAIGVSLAFVYLLRSLLFG
jgi:hypothetical protein